MLPLLSVMIFALVGIAALSVDAGLAFSTQARLASATPTLALERARFVEQEQQLGRDPDDPNGRWDSVARSVLEPLLGAAAIESESGTGLRLETATPEVEPTALDGRTEAHLRGHTPLLFGMAALLPTTRGPDGQRVGALSVSELNARRAQGDLTPELSSGGLRSTGFAPLGAAAVEYAPIVRVGAADDGLGIPGLAPVALFPGLLPPNAYEADPFTVNEASGEILAGDDVVGCLIDRGRTASLGPLTFGDFELGVRSPGLAYAPALEGAPEETPCDSGAGQVVGFLPVSVLVDLVQVLDVDALPRSLPNASTLPGDSGVDGAVATGSVSPLEGLSLARPPGGAGG